MTDVRGNLHNPSDGRFAGHLLSETGADVLDSFEDCDPDWIADCPACGEPADYCTGHGEIGDPKGAALLAAHDDNDHSMCVADCHTD